MGTFLPCSDECRRSPRLRPLLLHSNPVQAPRPACSSQGNESRINGRSGTEQHDDGDPSTRFPWAVRQRLRTGGRADYPFFSALTSTVPLEEQGEQEREAAAIASAAKNQEGASEPDEMNRGVAAGEPPLPSHGASPSQRRTLQTPPPSPPFVSAERASRRDSANSRRVKGKAGMEDEIRQGAKGGVLGGEGPPSVYCVHFPVFLRICNQRKVGSSQGMTNEPP